MKTLDEIKETIANHKVELKRNFSVKEIDIFGSFVRGEQEEGSDIDILVEFEDSTYYNFIGLVFYLEELLRREVDLVTAKGISPYLSSVVEREVVWCE